MKKQDNTFLLLKIVGMLKINAKYMILPQILASFIFLFEDNNPYFYESQQ